MTDCDRVHECEHAERRKSERRRVAGRTFSFCARLLGGVVALTAVVSIGASVSISSLIARTASFRHEVDMADLREWTQDLETRLLRLETK